MEKIRNLELISLLSDIPLVTNEKIENAYVCFTKHMKAFSQSEIDISKVYRLLNDTRIELVFIELLHQYEQGGKCPKICLS